MSSTALPMENNATGIPTGKLGMWLFLVSEVMMFAGFFGAYFVLRAGTPWPNPAEELNVPAAALNTVILLTSSMTMALAVAAVHKVDAAKTRLFLAITILFGLAFLGVKGWEYATKFQHHHYPNTNIFFGVYFTLTGIHGLHVIIGALMNLWVLLLTYRSDFFKSKGHLVEYSGLYWHFVDLVWIFLFPMVYLI